MKISLCFLSSLGSSCIHVRRYRLLYVDRYERMIHFFDAWSWFFFSTGNARNFRYLLVLNCPPSLRIMPGLYHSLNAAEYDGCRLECELPRTITQIPYEIKILLQGVSKHPILKHSIQPVSFHLLSILNPIYTDP